MEYEAFLYTNLDYKYPTVNGEQKDEPLDYFKSRKYLCREVYDLFVAPGLIQIPESLRFCTYAQYRWIEKALEILPNLTEEELR